MKSKMDPSVKIKKRLFDRISAFFMVVLVILNASFMVPVHAAFVGPVVVDSTVAVASALAALGIGVSGNASTPDWLAFINKIGDAVQDKMGGVTAEQYGNAIKYHLSHDFLASINQAFGDYVSSAEKASSLTSSFPSNAVLYQSNLATPITMEQFYSAIGCPYSSTRQYTGMNVKITGYTVVQKLFYSPFIDYFTDDISFTVAGKKYWMMNSSGGSSGGSYVYTKSGSNWKQVVSGSYLAMQMGQGYVFLDGYLVAFMLQGQVSPVYCIVNTAGASSNTNLYYFPTYQQLMVDTSEGAALPANDAQNSKFLTNLYADGASVLNQSQADVQSKLDAKAGEKDSTGAYTGDAVTVPADANTQNPSKLRDATATQTKVVGQDAATEADKTADDTYNKTNSKDTTPPKSTSMPSLELPTGLQKKFPFCLPWDLAAIYKLFNVAPKAPVWTIPINIDQGYLHVHQTYTYDLNQNNVMDTVLPIFKWFLNVSFCIGLIFVTKRIMT